MAKLLPNALDDIMDVRFNATVPSSRSPFACQALRALGRPLERNAHHFAAARLARGFHYELILAGGQ